MLKYEREQEDSDNEFVDVIESPPDYFFDKHLDRILDFMYNLQEDVPFLFLRLQGIHLNCLFTGMFPTSTFVTYLDRLVMTESTLYNRFLDEYDDVLELSFDKLITFLQQIDIDDTLDFEYPSYTTWCQFCYVYCYK